jgi:hypothetical protein
MPQFDCVILSATKDARALDATIRRIRRHIRPENVYVIAPKGSHRRYRDESIAWLDEDAVIPGVDLDFVRAMFRERGGNVARSGWYFQQFLKMGFSWSRFARDYYLVWDADTVPLRDISFFGRESGKPLMDLSREWIDERFDATVERLLGRGRGIPQTFIAEHMLIEASRMRALVTYLGGNGRPFVERIIDSLDHSATMPDSFSEFELYGTYLLKTDPGSFERRDLRSSRNVADSIGRRANRYDLLKYSNDFDFITIEQARADSKGKWRTRKAKNYLGYIRDRSGGGKRVAILYICTGRYERFWDQFFASCERNFLPRHEKHYFVFTDSHRVLRQDGGRVHALFQEAERWPLPTLKRFSYFMRQYEALKEFDYIYFFNANSLIVSRIGGRDIFPDRIKDEGLAVALHPGFYNRNRNDYPYERDLESLAYIPMGRGEHYYMGAFNGGASREFLDFIRTLRDRIDEDLSRGIVAVWHDESHLNRYMLGRTPRILDPGYLYPEGTDLPFLKRIVLIDKAKVDGGHAYLRAIGDDA